MIIVSAFSDEFKKIEKNFENWTQSYKSFTWFEKIYFLLKELLKNLISKLVSKSMKFCLIESILWKFYQESYLFCISKKKILEIFKDAHNDSEHWRKIDIIAKFTDICYWSSLSQNIIKYIKKCLKCAKHELATRSQSLHSIYVSFSFQLLEMNFIDLLKFMKTRNRYILNIICYFNRFVIFFICKNANAENVCCCLILYFLIYRTFLIFYYDREHHFENEKIKVFFNLEKYSLTSVSRVYSRVREWLKYLIAFWKTFWKKKMRSETNAWLRSLNFWIIEWFFIWVSIQSQ